MMRNTASKAIGVAALMVGLVFAGSAPASANAGGTDRPVRGTVSGTVRLNLVTNQFVAETAGVTGHLGRGSARVEGSGGFLPDRSFAGSGEAVIVAANGDEVHGDATVTTTPFTSEEVEHTTTLVITVTGGTGRFDGATGTVTSVMLITPIGVEGTTLVNGVEGTTRGRISY
jgi:hypothetical protein